MDIARAIQELQIFSHPNLTQKIAGIEVGFSNLPQNEVVDAVSKAGATCSALTAADIIKRAAGQIDVAIHALGILRCLPRILEPDEIIERLSLGAGNTGREYDLETNLRIAEFKFIRWQGGSETIRQNGVFKDFFNLAESTSHKRKFLYLLGIHHPRRFFRGGRAIRSVFSKEPSLLDDFQSKYPEISKVREYFEHAEGRVSVVDVSAWLPELVIDDRSPEQ